MYFYLQYVISPVDNCIRGDETKVPKTYRTKDVQDKNLKGQNTRKVKNLHDKRPNEKVPVIKKTYRTKYSKDT